VFAAAAAVQPLYGAFSLCEFARLLLGLSLLVALLEHGAVIWEPAESSLLTSFPLVSLPPMVQERLCLKKAG